MTDELAAHVRDAEWSVLGSCLIDRRALTLARPILEGLGMVGAREASTWAAMLSLADRDEPIDLVTLGAQLRSDGAQLPPDYLPRLTDYTPTAANVDHYARIVADYVRRDRMESATDQARGLMRLGDPCAAAEALADHARSLATVLRGLVPVKGVAKSTFEAWSETSARVQAGQSLDRMLTGLPAADAQIGGLFGGWLVLIAGRPGMGKTALLMQLALAVARQGKSVAVFSLEMTASELVGRMICQLSGAPFADLRDGRAGTQVWREVGAAAQQLADLPILVDDRAKLSITEIRAEARRVRPALVCVDYLQLMLPKGGGRDNREREVAQIGNGLVALAKELQVPVAVACALNREVGKRSDKRPMLSDLRESGALEQDAHLVLAPHRPGYYEQGKPATESELWCLKHRSGPAGWSVPLRWDGACTRFVDEAVQPQGRPEWQQEYER